MNIDKSAYSHEGPQCPYCGTQWTADESFYYDESRYVEDTCPECEKKFKVEVFHDVTWTTFPIEESVTPDK